VYALVYGGIQRFYFYDDGTIKSVFFNVGYEFNCYNWGISTTGSGNKSITEAEYTKLMNELAYNNGAIRLTDSYYEGGALLNKK